MTVKCLAAQVTQDGKVRYTVAMVDNGQVTTLTHSLLLDGADLVVGKIYDMTVTFQEPQ